MDLLHVGNELGGLLGAVDTGRRPGTLLPTVSPDVSIGAPVDDHLSDVDEHHPPIDNPYRLTERQLVIVERVLDHGEWVRAVREAGYEGKNAPQVAHKLRNNPKVTAELGRRLEMQAGSASVTPARILDKLQAIVDADITAALEVTKDGRIVLKPVSETPEEVRYAIKRVIIDQEGRLRSIEMEPRILAITWLGEHFRLWKPKGEAGGSEALVEEAMTLEKRLERNGKIIRERLTTRPSGQPVDI